MVAVITGNGLGLDNSSLRALGQGLGGQATTGQGGVAQYLNVATGNLTLQNADEGLIFDGLSLSALRTYNSQGQLTGSEGWLFGFSRSVGGLTGTLDAAGSTITRTGDDGSKVTYAYDATRGLYVSQDQSGAEDTLDWNATTSTWTWTDSADSQQETYDASGQLTSLSDTRSGARYSFSYSGGRLSTITAGDGDTLTFGYNTANQLVTLSIAEIPPGQTTAVTRQQVAYTYDAQGRLSTVTTTLDSDTAASAAQYLTTYTYDGTSDRVASVSQSDGTVVSYTYAADANGTYRVATITTGSGAAASTLTLDYDLATDTTTLTNVLGQTWSYTYNAAGQLSAVTAPSVDGNAPATTYQYDSHGNLQQTMDADGGITAYAYDARGNRLSAEDATGHTVSYTYSATDRLLSHTVYTIPAQGLAGQPGYVPPDGAQTTYYVYDASDRLSYVIDPLGDVTEHDYTTSNGLSLLSSTRQYGVSYSLAGLSPTTPPSLTDLQDWVASTPVQSTLNQGVRIDYTYDPLGRGQLATQTQWATLDSNGAGVLDAGTAITTYTYDAQGRLLQSGTQRGADRSTAETSSYAYDGLGRLVSRTDPLNQVTHYVYTDTASGDTLVITQANGLTTTQVRNSAGQLVSSTSSASGQASRVTTYLYDATGRNVATVDAMGGTHYTFYDADGRVAGVVDASGAVTSYRYDADGHVIGTTQYATALDTSSWISADALTASFPADLPLPTASVDDRTAHALFDAAGRAIATIDAEGDVVTTTYDGEGRAIRTIAYATALTAAQLTALGNAPTWAALQGVLSDNVNDRTTYTVYDADGRAAASIDASGFVTTMQYDTAGRVVSTTAYATALTAAQRTALGDAPSLSALQADLATSDNDQTALAYYDGAGRLVAQVDAEGYLTTTAYDETAHTDTTTRYAVALTTVLTGHESVATLVGLLGSTPAGEVATTTYDADGQVVSSTAADGTVTTYSYNAAGQLLSTTVTPATGQGSARTTGATYDAFGDTLTRVDGNQSTTTYTYNALGQRLTATDALGNVSYTYYDADGQIAYTVQGQPSGSARNATGNVTAYTYNAFGQVTATRTYASVLTLTSGSSSGTTLNPVTATLAQVASAVAALPVSASDANGLTTYSYTLDGQLASQTDGLGYQSAYTYDAFGDRTQVQQQLSAPGSALSAANGTLSTFGYDNRGEQIGEVDGVGTAVARSTSVTYDAFGRVTSRTDGDGHVVTFDYDRRGRQVSRSQTVGGTARTTQTTYDAFDRVVTQSDALGNLITYQYDLAQHKTLITTADGVTVTTVTDAYGDTVSVTDGAGNATTTTYDADGHVLTVEDALGHVSTNQYDVDGELIRTTDATGHVVTYDYDASGRVLTRTVDPDGLALATTYVYDGEGRQLSVIDPTGRATTYVYDADGHVLTLVQDAGTGRLNLATTYTYDGLGKTLTVTEGAGTADARTTQYVYDNLERLSQQIVDPGTGHLHLTTSYTYDADDHLTSVTDANGHRTLHVYNEAGEPVFTIDATGAVTQTVVDADGRVTARRAYATALTAAQLSALGSSPTAAAVGAAIVVSAGDTVSYTAYNAEGQVRYRIDPSGHVTETRYDAAGRVSETLAYAHAVSVTASEVAILQASQATALSSVTSLVSAAGNTDANAEVTLRLYDADGRTQFVVQQNTVDGHLVGTVSEQRYDAAGRVIATLVYGSTLSLSATTPLSAQLSTSSVAQILVTTPYQISQNVYDNAGRLRYTLDATNHVVETQYDADGRVLGQLTYANAISVPATLTEATVAAAVTAAGTAGARLSATTYDTAGRVHTTSDALGVNATYTYDATGLVVQQADRSGAVTVTTYDKAGRKTLVQSPSVTVGSYSGTTLQSATQYLYTQYQYDGVGNVTEISQGAGTSATAWTIQNTTTYAYDAAGHQTTTTYPGGTVTTVVTYNALGQAVVDKDANGNHQYKVYNADGEVAYAIDADGYVTGTVYDAYGQATAITRYATALNTSVISGWATGQPLSLTQLQQGLATSASDRTITTTYDQRNQKIQVRQSAVSYVLGMGASAGTAMAAASPTTTYTYDAYGNQTSSATLLQAANGSTPAIWATTYTYYDVLNRAVMTIDPAGQTTSPQGYVTTTTYDAFGDVTASTQYAGTITTAGVTVNSKPASPAANLYDRTTSYLYDSIGRKTRETDTGAYSSTGGIAVGSSVTTLVYDDAHRKLTVTVNGMAVVTQYDATGRVVSVTAPPRQALVSNWQTLLETTPADDLATAALYVTVSPVTTTLYDALGHTLSTTVSSGGLSQQTRSTYDALGRQATTTDADGHVTTFHYDNNGHLTSQVETLTANGASSTVTTTCTYDADGQQLSTLVQRSGQSGYDSYTRATYNAFGEITDKGDNLGYEAHYTYDNAGHLTSAPDATTGAIHTYAYDLAGHQVLDRNPLTGGSGTATTGNTVDLAGQVVQQTRPGDGATAAPVTFGYDRWGNVTTTTDAAGNVTHDLYDSQSHLISETEPEVLVVSATGVRTWATPTKTWYYNVNGQLTGVIDENGHTSLNTYDGAGHLTIAQDATAAKTYMGYDALGRAVAKQTPSASTLGGLVAHITYTTYDDQDQVVAQGDFLLSSDGTGRTRQAQQSYLLNSHGDRIRITDALGHAAYYDYDSQHRVIKSQTPLQYTSGWSETFSYDANGHKIRDTDANGASQTWVYDYFGRVTSHVDLSGASTTYAYDSHSGLLTSITSHWVPTGQSDPAYLASGWNGSTSTQNYSYYADGQIAQLTDYVDGVAQAWDSYDYDANGNTINDTHWGSDGTGQQQHLATLTTYDSHNRISTVTTKDTSTGTIESRETINYDAAGNRRAVFVQSAYGPTAAPISGTGAAPTVAALGTQTATAGQAWNLSVASHFTDNVGFGLTFTATQANGSALPSWMHFNSNGNFSGAPVANGSWSVTVTATDVNGQSVSTTFTVTVPVATPGFMYGAYPELGIVGQPASFVASNATDANGSALTFSAKLSSGAALPSWLHFDVSTRTFTGTPPAGSVGSYALTVTATAANGGSASETGIFTVIATPPVLNSTLANQAFPATQSFAFSFSPGVFNEADGDALWCTAGQYQMVPQGEGFPPEEEDSPLPSWMTFYGDSLAFTGTPPASAVGQTFKLYVKATNPQGQTAEGHFTFTVEAYTPPPPVYHNNLPSRSGIIGGPSVNFPLPSGVFTEADDSALTYSAMVLIPEHELDYPVGGGTDVATRTVAAQWVALSTVGLSINATSGTITGVPTTLDYVTSTYGAGSTVHATAYQIEIIATNAQSATATGAFTLSNTFAPPVQLQPLPNLTVNPEQGGVVVVQSNTFSDPYGHGLTYHATLASGAPLPGGLTWSGTSLYVGAMPAGSYAITVIATDGASGSATFTLTVNSAAPVFSAGAANRSVEQGTAFSYQVPVATDANGDALTYTAGYWSGSAWVALPSWMQFNAATHTYSGTPPDLGTFKFACWANDGHGGVVGESFTVTATPRPPAPPIYNGNLINHTGVIGASLSIGLSANAFTETPGNALTYTGMVLIPEHELDYPVGGGTDVATRTIAAQWVALSTVGLSINASSGAITGVPTTLDYVTSTYGAGSTVHATAYQIEIIATNSLGAAAAGTFTLSNSYAPPTQVTALTNHVANPGAGWVAIVPAGAFTDPYGSNLTYSATLSSGAALPAGLSWSGSSIYVGTVPSGSYAIKVYVKGLGATSATFTLTVNNVAPVFSAAATNQTVVRGTAFSYQVPLATDANGNALTYSAGYWSGSSWIALPSWMHFNASTHTYSGTPPTAGTFKFACWADDGHGGVVGESFYVTVNAPAPQPPVYNGGIPANVSFGGGSLTYTVPPTAFTSPAGLALTYSATTPAWLSFNASTRKFTASPPRADRTGTVTLTVKDSQGRSLTHTFNVDVLGTANNLMAVPEMDTQSPSASSADIASVTSAIPASPHAAQVQTETVQTETTGTTPNIESFWFTYDADNRVAVSNGALVNGQVVVTQGGYNMPSSANQYDAAGNVTVRITNDGTAQQQRLVYDARNELVESDFAVSTSATLGSLGRQQSMTYDADGRQLVVARYFRSDARGSASGTPDFPQGVEYMPIGGWLQTAQITHYNTDGTVASQSSWGRDGDWQRAAIMDVNYRDIQLPNEYIINPDGSGPLDQDSITSYTGYDHVGNVTAYSYSQASQSYPTYQAPYGASYTVQYLKKDGYLEQSTTGTPTVTGYIPATDTSYYDAFGRRTAVSQTSDSGSGVSQTSTRVFAYDTNGEILQRRSGTASGSTFTPYSGTTIDHYAYVEGQQVGMLDENGGIHVLDTLTGFSDGPSTQGYVVQAGDTLAGIAQAVYGNSQYGYLVADANGMTGDDDLVIGQAITLPSISTSANTSSTFKPYNPNEIVGSTTPSLPATPPPPPSQAGCSTLAMIVIIAVVIVASVFTAGLAAGLMAGEVGGFTSIMSAGAAAMAGAGGLAGMGAAAIGGFVGSAAGQLTGDALGVSHGFSFNQALTAGLAAGLSAGIGGEISAAGKSGASLLANSKGVMQPVGQALFGAGAYASQVGAAEITGQPEHFSWAGMAASAIASGLTAQAGLKSETLQKIGLGSDSPLGNLEGGLLSGGINREASLMLGDDHVSSWKSIGEDAFGNALGNAVIGAINSYEANRIPAIDTPEEPIEIAPATVSVADIPQSIAPVGSVQPTFSTNATQDQDSMAWRAPGYVSTSASIADATTLPAVTVHADGTVNVATAYTPAQEAEFQRTYAAAVTNQQMEQEIGLVNVARANAWQTNQQRLGMLHDLYQSAGRQALPYFVGPAILGAAAAIAPLTLAAGGVDTLTSGLTFSQITSGVAGGIGGYHADGPWGGIVGAASGVLFGGPVANLASKASDVVGGGLSGLFSYVATFTGLNGVAGGATTMTTNYATGKKSIWNGVGLSAALSATAPLLSAEAYVVAVGGVGEGIETAFGVYTNAVNLIEGYLAPSNESLAKQHLHMTGAKDELRPKQ